MKNFIKIVVILFFMCFVTYNYSYSYDFHSTSCQDAIVYKYATTKVSVIDPTVQNNVTGSTFPGHRGANQLVIYTSDYGNRTRTNEFGTEAIVENGFVVSISGADSLIPKNGFVISGHGKAKEWINQNIALGSKIIVDDKDMTITSYYTADSYLFATKEKVKEVLYLMKYYSNEKVMYDYTTAVDYLAKTKKAVKQSANSRNDSKKYSIQALDNANKAIMYSIPYYDTELKGVWVRPTQKNQGDIENTLDKLQAAGINNVFLETYFHGKTIYPSEVLTKYNVTNQHSAFIGSDPLKIWITEAHKRNMKVHIWFESFYVGNDNPKLNPNHILAVYPLWANTTRKQFESEAPVYSSNEHNGYFLDPANPDVQNFLLAVIDEIVTKYHPDGINLDYIRYPQTVDRGHSAYEDLSWGYTRYAREDFFSMYGVDPLTIEKNTSNWSLWAKYRQDKVSDFVRMAKTYIGDRAFVTAVIFPDRRRSLDTKMQDWSTWSKNNYVDGFTPLILSCDYKTSKKLLNDIKMHSSSATKIYAGLFVTFMNGTTDDLLRQVHMARQLNAGGVIIFDYNHFTPVYANAVSYSAFKPLDEKTIKKIQSGEISQQKLKTTLAKMVKEYNSEEVFAKIEENTVISKKDEQKEVEKFLKEINNPEQTNTKKKQEEKKKNKKPVKFAPDEKQGERGRFF